jgi:hypothetical protein
MRIKFNPSCGVDLSAAKREILCPFGGEVFVNNLLG